MKPPRPYSTAPVTRRDRQAARASKPGDPVRQGRPETPAALAVVDNGAPFAPVGTSEAVRFEVQPSGIEVAYLGVVPLAYVREQPNHPRAKASYWFLVPLLPNAPQAAATMEKARGAVRFKLAQWFEAADHKLSGAAQLRVIRG